MFFLSVIFIMNTTIITSMNHDANMIPAVTLMKHKHNAKMNKIASAGQYINMLMTTTYRNKNNIPKMFLIVSNTCFIFVLHCSF